MDKNDPVTFVIKKGKEIYQEKKNKIRKILPEKKLVIKKGVPGYKDVQDALKLLELMGFGDVSKFYKDLINKGRLLLDPNIGDGTAGNIKFFWHITVSLNPKFALPSSSSSTQPCQDSASLLFLAGTLYHEYCHYQIGFFFNIYGTLYRWVFGWDRSHALIYHQAFVFYLKWLERAVQSNSGIDCCLFNKIYDFMDECYQNILDYYPRYIYRDRIEKIIKAYEKLNDKCEKTSHGAVISAKISKNEYPFEYEIYEVKIKSR